MNTDFGDGLGLSQTSILWRKQRDGSILTDVWVLFNRKW